MLFCALKGLTVGARRKIGPMQTIKEQGLADQFLSPADAALSIAKNQRECPTLSDKDWLRMGTHRVLGDVRSGREFLQKWNLEEEMEIGVVHFFDTASSSRRLRLVSEVNELVASAMPEHAQSGFAAYEDFAKFDLYAGDGHYISASTHEKPIQGKKRPCGHFYALNLRTHGTTHLSGSDLEGGMKKSEHDMHALKRLGGQALRQGAPKGRKVLYAWDPAGIDIAQWGYWKSQYGVYFLSRAKSNMGFIVNRESEWDREDPVNAGVQRDTRVTTLTGKVSLRWIVYEDPKSGEVHEYITTEMTIRPGLLAWVYKCRWDIEKNYDTFKNKLGQTKAWGESDEAKNMQARFVCLAHNLMVLLEAELDVHDKKEIKRAEKRYAQARAEAERRGAVFAPQYQNPRKRTQIAAKFIRWLRYCIGANLLVRDAIRSLRRVYAMF